MKGDLPTSSRETNGLLCTVSDFPDISREYGEGEAIKIGVKVLPEIQ